MGVFAGGLLAGPAVNKEKIKHTGKLASKLSGERVLHTCMQTGLDQCTDTTLLVCLQTFW